MPYLPWICCFLLRVDESCLRCVRRVFHSSVEEIDLSGNIAVDAEWLAYLGAFRYLRVLNMADCKNVNNAAVWALSGTTPKLVVSITIEP